MTADELLTGQLIIGALQTLTSLALVFFTIKLSNSTKDYVEATKQLIDLQKKTLNYQQTSGTNKLIVDKIELKPGENLKSSYTYDSNGNIATNQITYNNDGKQ